MANKFSNKSLAQLATADPRLQVLAWAVLQHMDISILEGHRSLERQEVMYNHGRSKVLRGKHNERPSLALDMAPYPYPGNDKRPYYMLAGIVKVLSAALGTKVRWGGDWDSDDDFDDQIFNDLAHFELVEE